MRLANKVALITGGGSGIGRETALLFAAQGAAVLVADINNAAGTEVVGAIAAAGGQAAYAHADVSKAADCEAMVRAAEERFGKLNVIFNNAGIMHSRDDDAINTDEDVWDLTMAINLKGVYLGCKYGIPALRRAGGGSIINTASFVAILGAATPQVAYTASKGGVLAMTRDLAVTHARENIRVNALCPGPLRTELLMSFRSFDEQLSLEVGSTALREMGEARDIANAALYLASDEGRLVTGMALAVDAGLESVTFR